MTTYNAIGHEEAQNWGVCYLKKFLDGECASWWEALDRDDLINREALAHLAIAELDPEGSRCHGLLQLIHKTGIRTPEELWKEHGDELAAWGLQTQYLQQGDEVFDTKSRCLGRLSQTIDEFSFRRLASLPSFG